MLTRTIWFQKGLLEEEEKRRMSFDRWKEYYILGYAMFFAILTGVRVGELCAFQWDDVDWTNERIGLLRFRLIILFYIFFQT